MTTATTRRAILAGLPVAAVSAFVSAPPGEQIVTHEQMAAQDFEPVQKFGSFSLEDLPAIEENFNVISVAGRMSLVMLSKAKAELIGITRGMDAKDGGCSSEMLDFMTAAQETAQQLADLILAAQLRHVAAMANVYSEDGLPKAVQA